MLSYMNMNNTFDLNNPLIEILINILILNYILFHFLFLLKKKEEYNVIFLFYLLYVYLFFLLIFVDLLILCNNLKKILRNQKFHKDLIHYISLEIFFLILLNNLLFLILNIFFCLLIVILKEVFYLILEFDFFERIIF